MILHPNSCRTTYLVLGMWGKATFPSVSQCRYSTQTVERFPEIRSTSTSQMKRGTGGRSSFNGNIVTIFGATGFVGHGVCSRLGRVGTQMVIPYRGDSYDVLHLRLSGDLGQVVFYPYDLREYDSVKAAVKYSNIVINCVGRDWETMNFKFDDVHHTGAKTIAKACREMGVKKLIHLSALNAEEFPAPHILKTGSRFLSSKWKGELAVRSEFPDAIIFRPADVFGGSDRFLSYWGHWVRRQGRKCPVWRNGNYTVKQPVCVTNLTEAIVRVALNDGYEGKTIDAVGPNRYLMADLVDWIMKVCRRDHLGYKRYDMRRDPTFYLKVALISKFHYTWPYNTMVWDKVERECVSDVPVAEMTLEDCGVELVRLEDRIHHHLIRFRALNYLKEDIGMFDVVEPPPLYTDPHPPPLPEPYKLFG
ncbi:unnamed protein product [Cyprideis torosa]|uniref:NADH dehydrogenase [ubiquinone] 1 alpha subcomplex subunit 9, mitochondrial n=1 Tax=Cyprideis torosa TaxID=163714 RepID=A0A7R8W1N8_9CRUS|nr:unnamed protein product [Cyprideis torosa]CAG0881154.1 unnamed protein product [Cyprideis torosa]